MKFLRNDIYKLKSRIAFTLKPTRVDFYKVNPILEETDVILVDKNINLEGVYVGIVKDTDPYPYFPKFERFLSNNHISYGFLNIHDNQWLDNVKQFDVILWRPAASPWGLDEARNKIHILEKNILWKKETCYFRKCR